ncbi:MAG: AbrB family transcriptional regulator [Gammaproteobacteria bacterium]|nr:AbrB family transcriptional regulator [Gammaproteobacteria bacterium]
MVQIPLSRYLLIFALGFLGAIAAHFASLPIPWLLGSLLVATIAGAINLPVAMPPRKLERFMRVVVGVTLGPAVATSLQQNAGDLPLGVACAALITLLTVLFGMYWFQRGNWDRTTAFLMSLPGGLSILLALAGDTGNRPQVLLVHTIRVVSLLVFVSLLARYLGVPAEAAFLSSSFAVDTPSPWWLLVLLIIVGYLLSEHIPVPGIHVLLPMGITALVAVFQPLPVAAPEIFKTTAMLVFGCVLGLELASGPKASYGRLAVLSLVYTATATGMGALLAWGLSTVAQPEFLVLFLALAPGGIAEVSLVALALGLDVGLVALIHSCRFLFIIAAGPLGLNYLQRQARKTANP